MWERPWSEEFIEMEARNNTESVKANLETFLNTHGYTLDTFGEFIKEIDKKKSIIQIKMVPGGCEFLLIASDPDERLFHDHYNQDVYFQLNQFDTESILGGIMEGFKMSEARTGRFLFDKEGQIVYSYNRTDFDGDTMVLKKVKRKCKQGGVFVQETHFKKTNNKSKRW